MNKDKLIAKCDHVIGLDEPGDPYECNGDQMRVSDVWGRDRFHSHIYFNRVQSFNNYCCDCGKPITKKILEDALPPKEDLEGLPDYESNLLKDYLELVNKKYE